MKNIFAFLLCGFCLNCYSQSLNWVNTFGSNTDDIAYSLALDQHGNIYSAGYFSGPTDFDAGPGSFVLSGDNDTASIFIRKTDPIGNFIWAKEIKSVTTWTNNEVSISVDEQNNVYVAGHYFHKVDFDPGLNTNYLNTQWDEHCGFALTLDQNGNFRWAKCLNDFSGMAFSVCNDNNGNVYIGGSFANINDLDPGPATYTLDGGNYYNACITKLDTAGNFLWAIGFGGTDFEHLKCVSTDTLGNVYAAGYFQSVNADFDPGPGTYSMATQGEKDIYFCKFSSAGALVWAKQISGALNEEANAIAIDNNGFVYLTGYFENQTDFDPGPSSNILTTINYYNPFISKYDSTGNLIWAKHISGTDIGMGTSLSVNASTGNVITTGFMRGTADFDPGSGSFSLTSHDGTDIFMSHLDNNGNFLCAAMIGAAGYDVGYSTVTDNSGNIIIAGRFYGATDFEPGASIQTAVSNGSYDGFVAKYGRCTLTTDLKEEILSEINVFPNPSSGIFFLTGLPEEVIVYNQLGQPIYNCHSDKIELQFLQKGIYLLEWRTAKKIYRKKIILE